MKQLLLIVLIFVAGACATVPLTGRKQITAIPSNEIIALSNDSYKQVLSESKLSSNSQQSEAVKRVGLRISKAVENYMRSQNLSDRLDGYAWEFNLIEGDQLNAWCMPGGKIVFYEGIMPVCLNDNGIAVVMAHEISHALAQHGNERMSQQLALQLGGMALSEALAQQKETTQQLAMAAFGLGSQVGIMLPYSRKHEVEADELGLYFMAMAGYDPREAPAFWERMLQAGSSNVPEFLSTHPQPENRIANMNKAMDKAMEFYIESQQ
jgi:predicted Zn-dependent protease